VKYLDRSLLWSPIAYGLCTTEAEYRREVKRLGVISPSPFLCRPTAGATTHFLDSSDATNIAFGDIVAIVCIRRRDDVDPINVAALLCHEAVHIFQWVCARIGEEKPSDEFQAYSIQWIAQQLMFAYRDAPSKA
jgi:hypothetical protein